MERPTSRSKITRFRFRPDEDNTLRRLVAQYGTRSWGEVAARLPGRNIRQCRDRWFHYLADVRAQISWTSEEDALLRRKMKDGCLSWKRLSLLFQDKTPRDIQWRWSAMTQSPEPAFMEEPPRTVPDPPVTEESPLHQVAQDTAPEQPVVARDDDHAAFEFGDPSWLSLLGDEAMPGFF